MHKTYHTNLIAAIIATLLSCVPMGDQFMDRDKIPVDAVKMQISAAAAVQVYGAVYDTHTRIIIATESLTRVQFSLPVVEQSCLYSVQVTERPGEYSEITVTGQEEMTPFLHETVTSQGGMTWTRTGITLSPPHEVIDESAYVLEWTASGTDASRRGALEQVQFIYGTGPGC